jgi:putative transposase
VSHGDRRRLILLRREGWPVNRKLIERLYREEGLTLKRKRPKRQLSAVRREQSAPAGAINERWAMDFVHDTLSNGRTVRVLAVLDAYSRDCVALEAGRAFRGEDVARVLSAAAEKRASLPKIISVDNGTEFTSRALDHWACWNQVKFDLSRPGNPTVNPFIEAFNGSLRRECLSQHWFIDLDDAHRTLQAWKDEYNNVRPHSSFKDWTPAHFGGSGPFIPDPIRLGS